MNDRYQLVADPEKTPRPWPPVVEPVAPRLAKTPEEQPEEPLDKYDIGTLACTD